MATPRATIAILSIGSMGLGIASLLQSHNYRVITNVSDRSKATQDRAASAGIISFSDDEILVRRADYVLSIVPPRDAVATAKRVQKAAILRRPGNGRDNLYYLDLNAISPATVKSIERVFAECSQGIRFVDGGIIGGPPSLSQTEASGWTRPGIPLSGSHPLHEAPVSGAHLAEILNSRHLGPEIGSASGLKCCFAALSKGFAALALQSYTTASSLGVLGPLQDYLDVYNPAGRQRAEKSIVGCTGKAYRWVEEMNQINECFAEEGGWQDQGKVFREIAGLFQRLADVVEREGTEGMKDTEDVVQVLSGSLKKV
ncbi:6-phosphogluconate dehydrogenase C-terminal domain-like protein [Clathrospora elynae]|uniref:6-phosphogluconate dehydrogenase C-terminal domain-like protein n=1 Tax=Clathrospora elynae TaxID=706981 RepID=A0A6A5SP97_9PLEO|nr:6-phosphogluconate dehydrogenase C-terminal domain-like protein [Clathrospora elynae]